MFKFLRRIILIAIILVVVVVGYFMFNHTKNLKGGDLVTNTIDLEISKTYTVDVYKLAIDASSASVNIHPISDDGAYITYTVHKALVDEYGFNVKVDEENSKIDVYTGHNYSYKVDKFTIDIYCNFNKLILSSTVKYNVDAENCTNKLNVTYNGTKSLNISNLRCTEVDIKTNSSGSVTLAGNTNKIILKSTGSGNIAAKDLVSLTADIHLASSGSMTATVTSELNVILDGKGNMNYYGNPTLHTSGSGEGTAFQAQG